MYGGRTPENIFYYLTIYNEPYVQPAEPEDLDVEGLLRGIYRYRAAAPRAHQVRADPGLRGVAMPWALHGRATCWPRSGASPPTCGR